MRELDHTPDLVELTGVARDAGLDVALIERPMPDAVSVLGIGRRLDIVSCGSGAAVEDANGVRLDEEPGPTPLLAAQRLWRRRAPELGAPGQLPATGPVAIGGFAFDPEQEPGGPWLGFPGLLFRVPRLALARVRGRTFAWGDESLLAPEPGFSGHPAGRYRLASQRPPEEWMEAVRSAVARLRHGDADKVVLAREVLAEADGVMHAGTIARALRGAYPSCFTYLIAGNDGSAFIGASPELLVRRIGHLATCQPMAGSIARGEDDDQDRALAERLRASAKNGAEHLVTARQVAAGLEPLSREVRVQEPEIVRYTNIQHLATMIEADLRDPAAGLLDLAAVLHPTPAVGGMPRASAVRLIAELEGMERGWYAGAVGWMDARCDGELAIALRCGLLCPEGVRLFAGVGVMPDSDAQSELEETELKLKALSGALVGAGSA